MERRPVIGAVIGTIGLCLAVWIGWGLLREYRDFGKRPTPVSLRNASVGTDPDHGAWVELRDVELDCNATTRTDRQPPESWLLGDVQYTYFLGHTPERTRFVLLKQGGDATCNRVAAAAKIGVLRDSRYESRALASLGVTPPELPHVATLCLDCGPGESRAYILFDLAWILGSFWMIGHYYRKWRARMRAAESPFAGATR